MEKLILVGDSDQSIYGFRGAKTDLGMRPEIETITLKQSYRVSQAVHEFAERIINLIPPEDRLQREYFPTSEPGEVFNLNGDYRRPETWWPEIEKHIDNYQTVMILASCSYMLESVLAFLRREAIPFANSYRRARRDWNPLVHSQKQITAATRARDYLAGWNRPELSWTAQELSNWIGLTAGVMKRGGRDKIAALMSTAIVPRGLLLEVLPLEQIMTTGPEFILDHLAASHRRAEYQIRTGLKDPINVSQEPALTVGTYHSVKGGEADCVVAFPDMSPEASRVLRHGEIGPTTRMFFVGATRARTTLYLGQPVNPAFSLRWPG